jgi:hypothetical protein
VLHVTAPHPLDEYFDDLATNQPYEKNTRWEDTRSYALFRMSRYGTDRFKLMDEDEVVEVEEYEIEEEETLEYVEGRTYTNSELTMLADQILRDDTRRELCRKCQEYGEETGHVESQPQFKGDSPLVDDEGQMLYVEFPELMCKNGHRWYKGEGKARGNGGKDPILFKEHLDNRLRREIYNQMGVPDPGIVSGIYNRTHPEGRKVNSDAQRRAHGASFYR